MRCLILPANLRSFSESAKKSMENVKIQLILRAHKFAAEPLFLLRSPPHFPEEPQKTIKTLYWPDILRFAHTVDCGKLRKCNDNNT